MTSSRHQHHLLKRLRNILPRHCIRQVHIFLSPWFRKRLKLPRWAIANTGKVNILVAEMCLEPYVPLDFWFLLVF